MSGSLLRQTDIRADSSAEEGRLHDAPIFPGPNKYGSLQLRIEEPHPSRHRCGQLKDAIESGDVFDPMHMEKALLKEAIQQHALKPEEIQPEIQPPVGARQEVVVKSRQCRWAQILAGCFY